MKTIRWITLATLSLIASSTFAAGNCWGCKIKNLGVGPYYDSICTKACVFVVVDASINNRPSCASNNYWHFALDMTTVSGKAAYAFLLEAMASGRSINVAGVDDNCSLSNAGAVETLSFVNYAP